MSNNYYDIESLDNVFTVCIFKPKDNELEVYCLCDDYELADAITRNVSALANVIFERNGGRQFVVTYYDLRYELNNQTLARTMGLSDSYMVNDPILPSSYNKYDPTFRPVCDTDLNYDENKHPYLMGYNSYNYDTTILALYFHECFILNSGVIEKDAGGQIAASVKFLPTTAKTIRTYTDEMFSPEFKGFMPNRLVHILDRNTRMFVHTGYDDIRWRIRKNMLLTGRHIDVARLNEKQSKVGLKRLLGMLGHQILDSDKLSQNNCSIENLDQLFELIAYNASDVLNLEKLFVHSVYTGQFTLKRGLLQKYPELVYQQKNGTYEPDIQPHKVKKNRLTIDSSSAQFASNCLCPYGYLEDMPAVSFMYPSEEKSKELGIPRVNVLNESRRFFYDMFPQQELRNKFDVVYNYYKSIEGKDFNQSPQHKGYENAYSLAQHPKADTCLFYYNKDGTPSSCFITFGVGGIHGAEYNKTLFDSHMAKYESELELLNKIKQMFPNPVDLKIAERDTKKAIKADSKAENEESLLILNAAKFLKSGSTLKKAEYKTLVKPTLFIKSKDGSTKLSPKYVYTSADDVNHEDFISYYPNMLIMMSAFYNNGLGYDRYQEIFLNKQEYGKKMKDKSLSENERKMYDIMRDGTKLILNAASGAGDANFDNSIRMNNTIISMRIIGQLFSWRIGQAQTYAGARIVSTNTDGLYSVLDAKTNNEVLEREAATIHVEIEPEPMRLISKDSNNRLELDVQTDKITAASGGTLACREEPSPTKALAHPAILDWSLGEYLVVGAKNKYINATLSEPFNNDLGLKIIKSAHNKFDEIKLLRMFQTITASSSGTISYIFGTKHETPDKPIILQHYNRAFIMKDNTPDTIHLKMATARKLAPATIAKRYRDDDIAQIHDPLAKKVLAAHGIESYELPIEKEAVVKKIINIDESWFMLVQNKSLYELTQNERAFIIDNLDYDKYLRLLQECFESNWRVKMS